MLGRHELLVFALIRLCLGDLARTRRPSVLKSRPTQHERSPVRKAGRQSAGRWGGARRWAQPARIGEAVVPRGGALQGIDEAGPLGPASALRSTPAVRIARGSARLPS